MMMMMEGLNEREGTGKWDLGFCFNFLDLD